MLRERDSIEASVAYPVVRSYFETKLGSDPFARRRALVRLDKANAQFSGWVHTDVPLTDILEVMLPHHTHRAVAELVPRKGLSAREAYAKLRKIETAYSQQNPACMATIAYFKD